MDAFFKKVLPIVSGVVLAACGRGADSSTPDDVGTAGPAPAGAPTSVNAEESTVDRSFPLDKYTELDTSDPMVFRYLMAAFGGATLNDEEKMTFLSVEGATERDAFKRKDLAAKELPAINARLEKVKAQRYYKIFVYDPIALQKLNPRPSPAVAWTNSFGSLQHYSIDRKGFPVQCVADGSFSGQDIAVFFAGFMHPGRTCLLSVPDEATARAIEGAMKPTVFPMSATFYFHIDAPDRQGHGVDATLMRARVQLSTLALSPANPKPLADLDVELPQPVL